MKDIHEPESNEGIVDELHCLEVPRCHFNSHRFGDLSPIRHFKHEPSHCAGDMSIKDV